MIARSRSGIALITVVLVAALVFASIAGIVASVVPENKMIASRSASQRALTAAETGLSQVLFNLRNADWKASPQSTAPYGNAEYLTIADVTAIASASSPYTLIKDVPMVVPDGNGVPYVTYQVKIQKTAGAAFVPSDLATTTALENDLMIYSLGTVWSNSQMSTVLARKVIETTCSVNFNRATTQETIDGTHDVGLNYAMLSGVDITFNGATNQVLHGDLYAGGTIGKNGSGQGYVLLDGSAYATINVKPGVVEDPAKIATGVQSPLTKIEAMIAAQGALYSKQMALDFMNGTGLYDGTASNLAAGYPSTNRSGFSGLDKTVLDSIFVNYLGDATNFAKVASFYPDLKSGKILTDYGNLLSSAGKTFLQALQTVANIADPKATQKIVVYYKGDVKNATLSGVVQLGGAIVIDGDLSLNGGTTNCVLPVSDPPVGVNPLTLRVMGSVDLKGNGALVANIFASGETAGGGAAVSLGGGNPGDSFKLLGYVITPKDIKVGGGINFLGSLVAKENVTVGGTNDITYVDTGLGNVSVTVPSSTVVTSNSLKNVETAKTSGSSWREISFDAFDSLGD